MNVIGVILARGGSKGIPKKNIKLLNGKPLIAYTIKAAVDSNIFDEIVVSTDSDEIANISKEFGALVPFMRPSELSGDSVWSRDALKHAVVSSEEIFKKTYDYVIELPCIAPLRKSQHIIDVLNILKEGNCDSVTSVVKMEDKHPVRMKRIIDNQLKDFTKEFPEGEGSRRQDLEPCYLRNGAIYAMTRECIVKDFSRHGKICRPYIMSDKYSVNIDTLLDFKLAEILISEEN